MEMQGSRALAITQQQAWDALNDPQVLKTCIPGCDKLEATGENQYAVGMSVKIGPVAAKFAGKLLLSEVVPPDSYTINFDGQGGAAGFGKGKSQVHLTVPETGKGCVLNYSVQAQVGGKIAQMGQRLIDGVSKSMAEDFFKRFDNEMQRLHPEAYGVVAEAPAAVPAGAMVPATAGRIPVWVWFVGLAVLAVVVWLARR